MKPLQYIHVQSVRSISAVQIIIPNAVLAEVGLPRYMIFDEDAKRLRVPTINTAKKSTVSYNSQSSSIVSITPKYTPIDSLVGYWDYEVEDLSIYLTEKLK